MNHRWVPVLVSLNLLAITIAFITVMAQQHHAIIQTDIPFTPAHHQSPVSVHTGWGPCRCMDTRAVSIPTQTTDHIEPVDLAAWWNIRLTLVFLAFVALMAFGWFAFERNPVREEESADRR